jgi:photosystem II stability/assembly factor-like uncharacterized protein
LRVAQSPAVTFLIRSYLTGPRLVTVYRLAAGFASATVVGHLREPTLGDNGVDDADALDASDLWVGFVDIDRGGAPARLYRSTDGGADWSSVRYIARDFHAGSGDYPLFTSPDDGYLISASEVAQYTDLLHTDDAGRHWSIIATAGDKARHPTQMSYTPLVRTADGGLWQLSVLQGPHQYLDHSTDGGHHWRKIYLPGWAPRHLFIDSITEAGDTILAPYVTVAGRHHSRFGILEYADGRWTSSTTMTVHGRAGYYQNGAIAVSTNQSWTARPDAGPHPPLLTTENAGRTWHRYQVPRRVDGNHGVDEDSTLTAQPGGTAILINQWSAPAPKGPWRKLTLAH